MDVDVKAKLLLGGKNCLDCYNCSDLREEGFSKYRTECSYEDGKMNDSDHLCDGFKLRGPDAWESLQKALKDARRK
jgi:hypothetical protein